jgi:hypothetical protein
MYKFNSLTPHERFLRSKIDHISAKEAEFKKALARESGALGAFFVEKNGGRKSRDTVPLRKIRYDVLFREQFSSIRILDLASSTYYTIILL